MPVAYHKGKYSKLPAQDGEAELRSFIALVERINDSLETNKLRSQYWHAMSREEFDACCRREIKADGRPYPWQIDFHNAGAENRERAIIAGNQTGKTRTCGAEVAIHATGEYPDWWQGHRFSNPPKIIIGSETNETLRDPQQIELYGEFKPESRDPSGMGWVPRDRILGYTFRQCGITGVFDEVRVGHSSGGITTIKHKTFEQGWTKWQGGQADLVWIDEEPNDSKIYSETLRGLVTRGGLAILSRTPLFGMTWVIQHFMDGGSGIYVKNVTWDDAPHLTPERKAHFMRSIPPHELESRTKGLPMLGQGAIYPIGDSVIGCDPFNIPDHYRRIAGIDFGHTDHPTAMCWLAYDADTDIIYVYDVHKSTGQTIATYANILISHGDWIPVAWPHDGMQQDRQGGGQNICEGYRNCRVNMIFQSARYVPEKGSGQAREPIIGECYERMVSGRLKVFKHLNDWFEEKRMYHRKDNKVMTVNDDIISAMHYGVMMLRHATPAYIRGQQLQTECGVPGSDFIYA